MKFITEKYKLFKFAYEWSISFSITFPPLLIRSKFHIKEAKISWNIIAVHLWHLKAGQRIWIRKAPAQQVQDFRSELIHRLVIWLKASISSAVGNVSCWRWLDKTASAIRLHEITKTCTPPLSLTHLLQYYFGHWKKKTNFKKQYEDKYFTYTVQQLQQFM